MKKTKSFFLYLPDSQADGAQWENTCSSLVPLSPQSVKKSDDCNHLIDLSWPLSQHVPRARCHVITTINEATSVTAAARTFASGPPQTCFVAAASASQTAEGGRITWGAFYNFWFLAPTRDGDSVGSEQGPRSALQWFRWWCDHFMDNTFCPHNCCVTVEVLAHFNRENRVHGRLKIRLTFRSCNL